MGEKKGQIDFSIIGSMTRGRCLIGRMARACLGFPVRFASWQIAMIFALLPLCGLGFIKNMCNWKNESITHCHRPEGSCPTFSALRL